VTPGTAGAKARKVAWVTGAGKGIGREVAKRLSDDGWSVAVSARSEDDLRRLASDCRAETIHSFPLDVTDLSATVETVARISARLGPPDLVIFNAGTHLPLTADRFSVEDFRALVETNLMGTVNGLSQILPQMIARKSGHVAVVASLAGYRGLPTAAAYGATKAGLINMCEALNPELAQHGVRLTLINPGFVRTSLTDRNDFPMPDIISVEKAAAKIMRGLAANSFEVAFPWRFAFMMKLLRMLPDPMFFALTRRMVRP